MRKLILLTALFLFLASCGGGSPVVTDPGNNPPAGIPAIGGTWHLSSSSTPDGWPASCDATITRYSPTSGVYLLALPAAIVDGLALPADQAEKWESGIWIAETHDVTLTYTLYRSRLYFSTATEPYCYYVEVHLWADRVEFRLRYEGGGAAQVVYAAVK